MALPIRNSRLRLSQGQVFWREVGEGCTLVFLHGAWTSSDEWVPVLQLLGEQFHCVAPDLLGFGESERPKHHYSIELEVEYLSDYLEALRFRKVYLIGHSLGGWVAAQYGLRHPEQVKGLVLIAPEGVRPSTLAREWWRMRWLSGRSPLVAFGIRVAALVGKFFGKRKFWAAALQQRRQFLTAPVACELLFQRRPSEIQAELLDEHLPFLKSPVLIVQGSEDTAIATVLNQTYAQAPFVQLEKIPGAAPQFFATEAGAIAQQIAEFVTHQESVQAASP
jgi:pimeloyl-ACP methyl ester carboxylesterase